MHVFTHSEMSFSSSMSTSRIGTEISSSYVSNVGTQDLLDNKTILESSRSHTMEQTNTKLELPVNDVNKPKFEKTIEGCQVERSYTYCPFLKFVPNITISR